MLDTEMTSINFVPGQVCVAHGNTAFAGVCYVCGDGQAVLSPVRAPGAPWWDDRAEVVR